MAAPTADTIRKIQSALSCPVRSRPQVSPTEATTRRPARMHMALALRRAERGLIATPGVLAPAGPSRGGLHGDTTADRRARTRHRAHVERAADGLEAVARVRQARPADRRLVEPAAVVLDLERQVAVRTAQPDRRVVGVRVL